MLDLKNKTKGFTLLEILIVIAILAVLTVISLNTFVQIKNSQAQQMDTETIVETLRQARSQTLSSQSASQYGVHFASGAITLFTGASYVSNDPNNKIFTLSNVNVITASLSGGGSDIVFNRLSGETSQDG